MSGGGHIRSLDGVRGLAILLVLFFHAGLLGCGWIGVQLFFVLSGFLITGILWKERAAPTSRGHKFGKFWTRRALRIFPLYFGYLAALGVLYFATHYPTNYPAFAPYLFTYTFNYTRTMAIYNGPPVFSQLWSLCVEEQFYIVWPLIVLLCPARVVRSLMIVVIVLSPLIRYLLLGHYLGLGVSDTTAGDALYRNTLSHMDAFFLGGLLPVLSLPSRVRRPGLVFSCALLLAVFLGFLFWTAPTELGADQPLAGFYGQAVLAHGIPIWCYTVIDLVFASLILLVVSSGSKFFSMGWLVRIGQVSYGIYVFHLAIWWYTAEHLVMHFHGGVLMRLGLFVPYLFVVWGIAEISYRMFESKFIALKDKLFPGGGAAEIRATVPVGAQSVDV